MIRCLEVSCVAPSDCLTLRRIIESAFKRRLIAEYFEKKHFLRIYLASDDRGTAIVTDEGVSVPYLDKFAVAPEAQSNGVARELWNKLRAEHPRLYWRSRSSNPINDWYRRQADGYNKQNQWTVFWCGLTPAEVAVCVAQALAIPESLL